MKNILHITSSVNGENSYSIRLGNLITDRIQQAHPGSSVKVRDLTSPLVPHLTGEHVQAFYTDPSQHNEDQKEHVKFSDEFISELQAADTIVIGVPTYNFTIPSTLKAWLDHITRRGITFNYDGGVPQGYIKGKEVYLAFAASGVYSEGMMAPMDFAVSYLKFMLAFLGMEQVEIFRVEGLKAPHIGPELALEKAMAELDKHAF